MSLEFENYFSSQIVKAVKDIGFESLSEVQKNSIPPILEEKTLYVKQKQDQGKQLLFPFLLLKKLKARTLYQLLY